MPRLNEDAKIVLRDAGVSQAAWARANYMADGKWTGDPCGCPDSGRCMNGFHHFPDDECGCLRTLLDTYLAGEGTFAEFPKPPPDTSALDAVLAVVRDRPAGTAKAISYAARDGDGNLMEPGKVTRLLRELERRGLVRPWKRPGTRALLWSPVDA